jgi:ribose 5-phosphate isomerase RpiB
MEKIMIGADGMGYQLKDSIRFFFVGQRYGITDIGSFQNDHPLGN